MVDPLEPILQRPPADGRTIIRITHFGKLGLSLTQRIIGNSSIIQEMMINSILNDPVLLAQGIIIIMIIISPVRVTALAKGHQHQILYLIETNGDDSITISCVIPPLKLSGHSITKKIVTSSPYVHDRPCISTVKDNQTRQL